MVKLTYTFIIILNFFLLKAVHAQTENASDAIQPVVESKVVNEPSQSPISTTATDSRIPGQFFLDDEEKFIYDPTLKRDPFQIIGIKDIIKKVESLSDGKTQIQEKEVTDPLQKADVEDFKVIGIMWEGQKPKAILQDRSNRNHLVFTGTRLGNKNGYVAMIREGQVVVMEYVDEEGRVVKKPKTLEITRSK